MNRGFGTRAQRLAERWPADADVVVFDLANAVQALAECYDLRRAGADFAAAVVLDDGDTALAASLAPQFLQAASDYDARRVYFEALGFRTLNINDVAMRDAGALDAAQAVTAAAVLRLAPRVVVSSMREYYRLASLLGVWPEFRLAAPRPPQTAVPAFAADGPVVVWAPDDAPERQALTAFALEQLHADVVVVAASVPASPTGLRARFVAAGSPDVPGTACVLVDGATHDPGWAIALAAGSDAPLAVASTSGALEWVAGAALYDPAAHRSVASAVARARGSDRARPIASHPPSEALVDPPLVSVYVPTHDRPAFLAEALASLAAQTYPNIEIVVVNDAGTPVDDVVARYANARVVPHFENLGPARAKATGVAAARGRFVLGLDDDDLFFPDHIERLVRAALRSGAAVVHADAIRVYHDPVGDRWTPYGFEVVDVTSLDRTDLLQAARFLTHQVLYRRDVFDAVGNYVDLPAAEDYDLWLSLADRFDWVHVAAPTAVYRIRSDQTSTTARIGNRYLDAHLAVFARHPASRPAILAGREGTLAAIRSAGREPQRQPALRVQR